MSGRRRADSPAAARRTFGDMRRVRNLAIFGFAVLAIVVAIGWTFRAQLLQRLGVNLDGGASSEASLVVPAGYAASVFAEGLSNPRFMALSPDGVLFVAERGADRVIALPDEDGDGRADGVVEVGTGYGNAHDLAFTDAGTLFVAGSGTLYEVTLDGLTEVDRRVVVADLPTGGSHTTKSVAVLPGGEVLLSIGSSCNVCVEEDARRASVQLVAVDGGMRPFMTGLRNAVGLWVDPDTGRAWATNMGRDLLGDDRPPETLYELTDGADAGWPRCNAGEPDPDLGTGPEPCAGVADPAARFPAHTAPLDLVGWREHLVIAFHGSWNSSVKVGYDVRWLPWDGGPAGPAEVLVSGFLPDGAEAAAGRPAGLAVGADDALYVSDDKGGFVYRITRP